MGTLAAIYFAAGKLGLQLAFVHPSATAVWPPTGITLAALLVLGYRVWPGIFLGAFLVNVTTAGSVATSLGIATGNTLEGVVGAYLVNRFANGRNAFERPQDIFKFAVLASMVSTTVSATLGVASLSLGGFAGGARTDAIWLTWWLGDAVGDLIVAPLLLLWSARPRVRWDPGQASEAALLLLTLVLVGQAVFGGLIPTQAKDYPLNFLCVPILTWAAFRFGRREAATANFLLSGIATLGTLRGFGPFARATQNESLLLLQAFMGVLAVTTLAMVALVSERKRVEEALLQSEKRYPELFENATEIVFTLDLAGNLTSLNKTGERITEYTRDEAVRMNFVQVAAPESVEWAGQMLARQVAEETPLFYELEIRTKGGRRVLLEISSRLIFQDGNPVGVQSTAHDITERRQAAAALEQRTAELAESEQRHRMLAENAQDGIISVDEDGRILLFNRKAEELFGYSRQDVWGKTATFLMPAEFIGRHREGLARYRATGRSQLVGGPPMELVGVRKDGREFPLELTLSAAGCGPHLEFTAIIRDITERRRVVAALEQANRKLTGWVKDLEERVRHIALLSDMSDFLQTCLTPEEAYAVVAQFVPKLFPAGSGMLGVLSVSKKVVEVVAAWGDFPLGERTFPVDACWALRRGRVHLVEPPHLELLCGHVDPSLSTSHLCVSMMAQGEPLGVLHLRGGPSGSSRPDVSPEDAREARQRLAVDVAQHIALALANLKLQEKLHSQVIRDSLTGLFNRRYMEESLEREVRRAACGGTPLGIIMADIDQFKPFNDAFGHEAGDRLLAALGEFLRAHIRVGDIACRYGGEEFTLILPEATLDVTRGRAEQIREAVRKLQVSRGGELLGPVTLSLGVAAFPGHGSTAQALLLAADAALYRAKSEGRDRVVAAG